MHVEVHHIRAVCWAAACRQDVLGCCMSARCAGLLHAGKMCWAAVCRQDVLGLYMEVKVTIRTVTSKY